MVTDLIQPKSAWLLCLLLCTCAPPPAEPAAAGDNGFAGTSFTRAEYGRKLEGFWLGQCIANWTGLVTEMDKIGEIGELKTGAFYTRNDWGTTDLPSIWGEGKPSDLSATIDFVFRGPDSIWGADDDTDIEYMYQHLLDSLKTSILTPEQIREGWLRHIRPEEENYLWVSNQRAFDLMREGMLPPTTGDSLHNEHHAMIDAQLTTEIFGLFAPGRPEAARKMAELPIRTVARGDAAAISEFYVTMYSLAAIVDSTESIESAIMRCAAEASKTLPVGSYSAAMYDFVRDMHAAGHPWERTRDSLYVRYQVEQQNGYDLTSQNLYCNGCFAAGINFGASLVSLFYGAGDLVETIKIGSLCGWDSDNPTATWGGMLGFMLGRGGVEAAFGGREFSNRFNIHRTRQNFSADGIDTFENMAETGLRITERAASQSSFTPES